MAVNHVTQRHSGSIEHIDPPIELALGWKPRDEPIRQHIRTLITPDHLDRLTDTEERNFFYGHIDDGQNVVVQKINQFLAWKVEIDFANYLAEPIMDSAVYNLLPISIYHSDLQGHPVVYLQANKASGSGIKKLPDKVLENYFIRLCIHLDQIKQNIRDQSDQVIWRHTLVVDMKGIGVFGLKKIKGILSSLFTLVDANFPETAHVIYIINTDWKFRATKSLFDFMLSARTKEKLKILGSSFLTKLVDTIPIQNIPTEYGGQNIEPLLAGRIYLPHHEFKVHYPESTI